MTTVLDTVPATILGAVLGAVLGTSCRWWLVPVRCRRVVMASQTAVPLDRVEDLERVARHPDSASTGHPRRLLRLPHLLAQRTPIHRDRLWLGTDRVEAELPHQFDLQEAVVMHDHEDRSPLLDPEAAERDPIEPAARRHAPALQRNRGHLHRVQWPLSRQLCCRLRRDPMRRQDHRQKRLQAREELFALLLAGCGYSGGRRPKVAQMS